MSHKIVTHCLCFLSSTIRRNYNQATAYYFKTSTFTPAWTLYPSFTVAQQNRLSEESHVHVYAINSAVLILSCNSLKSCIFQRLNHQPCKTLCQNQTYWISVINNRLVFELILYSLVNFHFNPQIIFGVIVSN